VLSRCEGSFHKGKRKNTIKGEDESQNRCEYLNMESYNGSHDRIENKEAKTRTRHILELKLEWKWNGKI